MLQFLTLPDRPPSPLSRQRPSSYLFLSPSSNHHHWWFNKVPEFRSAFSPHHPVMTSDHQQGLIAGSLNLISDRLIPKSCILILKYRPPPLGRGVQFHCYNSLLSKNNILSSSWLQQPQSPRGVVDFDFVSYSLSSGHSKLLQPCLENPGCLWGCYCHFIWSCQEILFLKLLRCRNRSRQQYENILSVCLPVPTAQM